MKIGDKVRLRDDKSAYGIDNRKVGDTGVVDDVNRGVGEHCNKMVKVKWDKEREYGYSIISISSLEVVNVSNAITWEDGKLTINGGESVSVCGAGFTAATGIKPIKGATYELKVEVVKVTEPPKFKVGQVIRCRGIDVRKCRGNYIKTEGHKVWYYSEDKGGAVDWMHIDNAEVHP